MFPRIKPASLHIRIFNLHYSIFLVEQAFRDLLANM